MRKVSFVIPALNEEENIPRVMATIPSSELLNAGWRFEVVVVDNGSIDRTAELALNLGARVIPCAARGYGNAYKAGFEAAQGSVIVTGDADCTYPFDHAPRLLEHLNTGPFDFLSTNRLGRSNADAMKRSHVYANHLLTLTSRSLFRSPFRDSQSGMWIFSRNVWRALDVRSPGMAFSQEIKHEAYLKGFRCAEVPIEYRPRGGEVKLNAARDGIRNTSQLFAHRVRMLRSERALADFEQSAVGG